MKNVIQNLKDKGYRITQSRRDLVEIFYTNKSTHYTHEQLIKELSKKEDKINNMSVYNNLKILLKEDVIKESIYQGKKIYEFSEPTHAHFYCKNCKKDLDIDVDKASFLKISKNFEKEYGIKITDVKM